MLAHLRLLIRPIYIQHGRLAQPYLTFSFSKRIKTSFFIGQSHSSYSSLSMTAAT